MLYRRFEQLIDIFRDAPSAAPPDKVLPFYIYYLRQVWPCFAALLVVGLIGAANRDPAVFPDPHVFDIRRSPNKHLSFGHGPHQCLGAPLARLEAALAFPRLLGRLPDLTLDGDEVKWKDDFSTRRLVRLMVRSK